MAVFWDVARCSLVDTDCHFRGAYCLRPKGNEWHPDDGGCKLLWNDSQYLPGYMVQHPEDSHLHTCNQENMKSHQ
jgi:hypothetical protein